MATALAAPVLSEANWRTVNDTVMGGVSSSTVEMDASLVFSGDLSLEQNGGFTSIRGNGVDGALLDATGLRVVVRGDGRTYNLTLQRSDRRLRAGNYRVKIATVDGETTELSVPLADFRPTSFGRPVNGAPALDAAPERVDQVGFLLADGNPGAFRLEVLSLDTITGRQPRGDSHSAILQQLAAAISDGVPMFNSGNVAGCASIYQAALTTVQSSNGLTPGEHSLIREALATAQSQDPTAAAWTLRYAIDSVLASAD